MINDNLLEAAHLNLQINQERQQSNVFTVVGHVSGVDPTTNRIKVVIPSWTNDNTTYIESGWIPLGTPVAGNQFGIQMLPFGQATVTDPTGMSAAQNGNTPMAEQVLVHVIGRKRGLYIQSVQTFNQVDVPPSGYQDKSDVQARAGEWLFKHSTGSYLYFSNDNLVELVSLTNPAPVVQTNQTPSDLTQTMNLGVQAVGTNSNTNGDMPATVNANLNVGTIATAGQTNNATVLEAVTSDTKGTANKTTNITADNTQGTGQYNITIQSNDSTMTINIDGNTNTYNLNVTNGTVNVTSDTTNVKSDTVNLGTGTMRRILNDVAAQVYNSHTHNGVQTGSGTSGPPNQTITDSDESQNAYSS